MPTLCRSCYTETAEAANICGRCGSDLLVTHQDLNNLSTAHIDCDAFYANIEKRDNPELKDKPVLVGGGKRGVVMAACYVARLAGVQSAMPMFKALKACPEAVVIKPNMRIGQIVFSPIVRVQFKLGTVNIFETKRSSKGFGSTGLE